MITFVNLNFFIFLLTVTLVRMKSPVKMSIFLMILSSLVFMKMFYMSGSAWFPMLFFLIFMGGILMMFMILSSILPNERSLKLKKVFFIFYLMIIFTMTEMKSQNIMNTCKPIQSILDSSSTTSSLLILMLSYFFMNILMVSKEESPMRKSMC